MADIKWSAFPTIASPTSGDTLVGLHSGANYQFTGLTIPFSPTVGGTGVVNGSGSTITLGGSLTLSGAFAFTGTLTGATSVTFPTSGTLATTSGVVTSVSGTGNRITSTGGTTPTIDISASYVGQASITTVGTVATGVWQGTVVGPTYGGTGVNNGSNTLTLAGNLTTAGAFASTFTMTGATSVTFPTSGTLATTSTASGIINAGTTNQMAWYAGNGSTISGLNTGNSGVLITSGAGVPSISSTLPSGIAATNMALTTPALGTPSSGVLSSCTGYPQSALTGLGTGVSTALAINIGTAGSPVVNGGALGTPASGTLTNCTGLPIAGTTGYGTGVATALAANVTGSGSIVLANAPTFVTGTVTAPSVTFSTTSGIIGTTTNNNAAAGSVGELITFNLPAASAVSMTSGTGRDIGSISLTAGDWDVFGSVTYVGNTATVVQLAQGWINTTSATTPDGSMIASLVFGAVGVAAFYIGGIPLALTVPTVRLSLSGTTTVYLSGALIFTTNTAQGCGTIYARRRR